MTRLTAMAVTAQRGAVRVLCDVDLEMGAGELVCVVGPNGAGKSTLLSVLAGDLVPVSGEVAIDGDPLRRIAPRELALRRSVLAQRHQVAFGFTALEVVEMGRAPHRSAGAALVSATLSRLDIGHLAHRPFRSLSGGEQARVALARVLVQDTPVLLLDEPTAALDLRHQELVMTIAREQADMGRTVAVVVHDLNLAAAHADRIILVADGRIGADGVPGEVLRAELLEAAYGICVTVVEHPVRRCPLVLVSP